jgi:acyl-CoA synthetase (AMP-forming)/AMP-acid ligase II
LSTSFSPAGRRHLRFGQCFHQAGQAEIHPEQINAPATPLAILNIDLDLACLVYTSGSTGEPKGVMCDHSNVRFASTSIITYLENREDDVVLGVLPLSFDYGLYQLLMTIKFGGTLVLERSFAYPALILQRIQEERITRRSDTRRSTQTDGLDNNARMDSPIFCSRRSRADAVRGADQ